MKDKPDFQLLTCNHQLKSSIYQISIVIMLLFGLIACKSAEIIPQKIAETQQKSETDNSFIREKISIIPNQRLSVEKNEMGKKYLKTLPGEHIVIKYSYLQSPKDNSIMDARYTENVWIEIPDKSLKTNDFNNDFFQKNPLYVQVYGFRNVKLIPVTNAEMHIKIINKQTAQISINIKDTNMLIRQRNIKQTIKF